jgi:hypothetical protein
MFFSFFPTIPRASCELAIGRESEFTNIHGGPYKVLVDKKGILNGAVFPWHEAEQNDQIETLRRLIVVFWHDFSHFIKAMARGQLWWAHGQLDILRLMCVNLARLRHNFADSEVGEEGYFKIESAMPIEQLSALKESFCPMERAAMLRAGHVIVGFYRELAQQLGQAHGISYPDRLERVMLARMEKL